MVRYFGKLDGRSFKDSIDDLLFVDCAYVVL